MNRADFDTQPDGFPLESDATLGFMQSDYQDAIRALAKLAGSDNIIITGLTVSGGSVSDGWILFSGDLVFFEGGAIQSDFILVEDVTQKANQNGQLVDRYFVKKAQFGSGTGATPFSNLKRIESLNSLFDKFTAILGLESAVVISGCQVSNVNEGASTCDISAGVILIDGSFVNVAAYSSQYPAYLKPNGTYDLVQPGSGSYITFDPYTSQYVHDVWHRRMNPVGEVRQRVVDLSWFDGTGLGRWQMKGWALMNGSNGTFDKRGRFGVGYDERLVNPNNDIWDFTYSNLGSTGGEKDHQLTIGEMPRHNHQSLNEGTVPAGGRGLARRSVAGENVTTDGTDTSQSGTELDIVNEPTYIPPEGADQAHENRPPYTVIAYIQRI